MADRILLRRFIRFPGGCYVEGDRLANSFYWKKSIGPAAERPGHWNLWGYWSTDGAHGIGASSSRCRSRRRGRLLALAATLVRIMRSTAYGKAGVVQAL